MHADDKSQAESESCISDASTIPRQSEPSRQYPDPLIGFSASWSSRLQSSMSSNPTVARILAKDKDEPTNTIILRLCPSLQQKEYLSTRINQKNHKRISKLHRDKLIEKHGTRREGVTR